MTISRRFIQTAALACVVIATSLENAHLVEQLQGTLESERRLADEESTRQELTRIGETAGAFDELAGTTIRHILPIVGAVAGSYALITDRDRLDHTASVGLDRTFTELAYGLPASEIATVDCGIVEQIFRQNISMGKGMGLMAMVNAVQALAKAAG